MSGKSIAIKRINKDIKEINKEPKEGIGIVSLDNDPMRYIVNIKLMEGPYKNYCVQLLLTFPDNYPVKPPKILIYPDQAIDGQYHHHIFRDETKDENGHNFKKFCFDLLDNDFMDTKEENTGWNPSYNISSLLLNVQSFLCDPDMHGYNPPQNKIDQLFDSMNKYQRNFKIENDKGEQEIITHTWNKPYPEKIVKKENEKNDEKKEENKNFLKMQQIKENLTCFMLKLNYIDDPDILLGYPIIQTKTGKDKIELYPIPELLTYDGFVAQIGKQDYKLDFYFDVKFKSANNKFYNYWVPIYIDENHYKKNRTAILNSFSVIKYGALGIKEYDFKPEHIFEVLPIILNKMIIGIFNGKTTISSAFIRCYFQYVLLFKKLCLEFEEQYLKYLNHILNLIKKNNYDITKQIIPDIGNFFMLLFFSNKNTHTEKMKQMWYALFEESSTRKPFWTFHGDDLRPKMKKIIFKDRKPLVDDVCLKRFEEDNNFNIYSNEKFIEDLKSKNIFNKIIDIINSDDNFKSITKYVGFPDDYYDDDDDNFLDDYPPLESHSPFKTITNSEKKKEIIIEDISKSFKDTFLKCNKESRNKIYNIILNKLKFANYFSVKKDEIYKKYEEKTEIRNELYDSCKVDVLLKDKKIKNIDEIVQFAFDNQIGNKLLIITFFTAKKIENKDFMKELEDNYGIYLDVDIFIKEMNQKLNEIKSLKEMYEYIGSDFGEDEEDDLEIIIKSYQRAKKKGYIREPYNPMHSNTHTFRGGSNRGRGNFRGSRGGRGSGRGNKRGH